MDCEWEQCRLFAASLAGSLHAARWFAHLQHSAVTSVQICADSLWLTWRPTQQQELLIDRHLSVSPLRLLSLDAGRWLGTCAPKDGGIPGLHPAQYIPVDLLIAEQLHEAFRPVFVNPERLAILLLLLLLLLLLCCLCCHGSGLLKSLVEGLLLGVGQKLSNRARRAAGLWPMASLAGLLQVQ